MGTMDRGAEPMPMTVRQRKPVPGPAVAAAIAALVACGAADPSWSADGAQSGNYQIVKATGDRVWRLNKNTGEIAVCTLNGENLICTTSSEAMKPPNKTFEQYQAEIEQGKADAARRRDAERAKDLAFLERAFDAIKSLIRAAMERDAPAQDGAH